MAWLSNTVHTTYGHVFRPERYVDGEAAREAVKAKAKAMYGDCLKEIDGLLAGRQWAIGNHYTVVDGYLLVFYRWGKPPGLSREVHGELRAAHGPRHGPAGGEEGHGGRGHHAGLVTA